MLVRVFFTLLMALAGASTVTAHPHVTVTIRAVISLDAANKITTIRQSWTFDEAFSAYSVIGLDANKDGVFSRDELAPLAKINIESLEEYTYFTTLRQAKEKAKFGKVTDYHLSFEDSALTLHFALPAEGEFSAADSRLTIADPSFFVAFDFAEKTPISLSGGKLNCTPVLRRPGASTMQRLSELGESLFRSGNTAETAANDASTPVTFTCK